MSDTIIVGQCKVREPTSPLAALIWTVPMVLKAGTLSAEVLAQQLVRLR